MNRRIITVFLIAFLMLTFVSSGFAVEKDVFNLSEAEELVLRNSRAIKSMEERVKEVEAQKYIASNAYDSVRYGGYYNALHQQNMIGKELKEVMEQLKIAEKNNASDEEIEGLKSYALMLEMQMAGAQMAIEQSSESSKQVRKSYDAVKDGFEDIKRAQKDMDQQLIYATQQLYTGILLLEAQVKHLEQNYTLLVKMLEVERLKKDLGISSDADVEKLAAQTSELNRTVDQLRENLKLTKWTLNDMMGRELNAKLELAPVETKPYIPIARAQSYIDQAMEKVAFIPQLERDIENFKKEIDDLSGSNEIAVEQAKLNQTKLTLEDKKQELINQVTTLVNDVNIKGRAYQLAEYSLKTAEQEYEWDKKKYELGLLAKLQLDAAELAYYEALNKKTAAAYEYFLARSALEMAEQGILAF